MYKFKTNYLYIIISCLLASIISCAIKYLSIFKGLDSIFMLQMPILSSFGFISASIFIILSTYLFDSVTYKIGIWTYLNIIGYILINIFGYKYLNKKLNISNNKKFIFVLLSTIMFDAITASSGPIFFNQQLLDTFLGQIPFTLLHLLSNIINIFLVYPFIMKILNSKHIEKQNTLISA